MKRIQAGLALALLLFAGLNCGTESPIEEKGDVVGIETQTGMLQGEIQPIEGILIQVRLLRNGQLLTQLETQATYELEGVEAGSYTLRISAKGYETRDIRVTVVAGQSVSVDKVTLAALESPLSHLRGRLTDVTSSAPISEVHLQLIDKMGKVYEALTTEAGVFAFENLPVGQGFTLKIEHEDYERTEVAVQPIPEAETLAIDLKLIPLPAVEALAPGQGLNIGSRAPDFELSDGNGEGHKLANYIGKENVVIVFFRGVW